MNKRIHTKKTFSFFIIGETTLTIECMEILLHQGHIIGGIASSDKQIVNWSQQKEIPLTIADKRAIEVALTSQEFDYLICIAPSISPDSIKSIRRFRTFHYQDSLLPKYQGKFAPSRALINQEKEHGVTWYLIDSRSFVVNQTPFYIDPGETAFSLNIKCYGAASESFRQLEKELSIGLEEKEYTEIQFEESKLEVEWPFPGLILSFERPAQEIEAFTRALNFGEMNNPIGIPKVLIGSNVFLLTEIKLLDIPSHKSPGTVTKITPKSIDVSTSTYDVEITKLFTYDGKRLSIPRFIELTNLKVDSRIPTVDPTVAQSIDKTLLNITDQEENWIKSLSSLRSIDIPFETLLNQPQSSGIMMKMISVPEIPRIDDISLDQNEIILSVLLAFLSRITGIFAYNVQFANPAIRKYAKQLEEVFPKYIPLLAKVNLEENFLVFCEMIHTELAKKQSWRTYPLDIFIRYPKQNPPLINPEEKLSISFELVDTLNSIDPPNEMKLSFVIPNQEKEVLLFYDSSILSESAINQLTHHFSLFLQGVISNPQLSLSNLPILSQEDQSQLLLEFNATDAEFPKHETLDTLFKDQVKKTPNNVAIVFESNSLTYKELDELSDQLANEIQKRENGKEKIVALMLDVSVELVVGMIGILKAGYAFLPIDPNYPKERIEFMLQDSNTSILLTQIGLDNQIDFDGEVIHIILESLLIHDQPGYIEDPNPTNLAYVLYTSGTTGLPKGVQIQHNSIVNQISGLIKMYQFDSTLRHILLASPTFDPSVQQIFLPLTTGGMLFLISKSMKEDVRNLVELIIDNRIDVINTVPSLMGVMLDYFDNQHPLHLRYLILAGEVFSKNLYSRIQEVIPADKVINIYGPTEATINTTLYECKPEENGLSIPIGRPLQNYKIFILDKYHNLVPIGVAGEICISGIGLARGYQNNTKLTNELFVPNPFLNNQKMYKTGDLGRWLDNGNIEILGRIDHQVKIHGTRIELSGIEHVIGQYSSIQDVVVIVRDQITGEKQIVAYVVFKKEEPTAVNDLREYLRDKLPAQMIPSAIVILESLPLTPNGKIDREKLPTPEIFRDPLPVTSNDELELRLVKIWERLFDMRPIGIKDNFFDLGGYSLLAVRLIAQIENSLGVKIPLATLLKAPTIEELADVLRDKNWSSDWDVLIPIQPDGTKPPLYFVHGAGGNILLYQPLAKHLGKDQPLYGLQSRGLRGRELSHTSIDQMANHYIKEIQTIQPEGPYLLGGYCMGGTIAYEMAQQLSAEGHKVPLIILLDTYFDWGKFTNPPYQKKMQFLVQKISFQWRNFRLLDHEKRWKFFWEKAKIAEQIIKNKFTLNGVEATLVEKINVQAANIYVPKKYSGRVVLLSPSTQYSRYKDIQEGWLLLISGDIIFREIPAYPGGMLLEPFVELLANELQICINNITREESSKNL